MKRHRPPPAIEDFGPQESLRSGRVRVVGDRPRRNGRVVDTLSTMGRREQEAAAMVLRLFEAAHYSGFCLSKPERITSGGFRDLAPSEAAAAARRKLARIRSGLAPEHWSVIWHTLFFGECARLHALRARCRKADVRERLQAALTAVAELR